MPTQTAYTVPIGRPPIAYARPAMLPARLTAKTVVGPSTTAAPIWLVCWRSGSGGHGLGVCGASVTSAGPGSGRGRGGRPGRGVGGEVPDQAGDQVADLGNRELGQLATQVGGPFFSPCVAARVTVRKACARQARVMCRYQAS